MNTKLNKNELKSIMLERQDGVCAISKLPLPEDTKLFDLDRFPIPGNEGGKYELGNVRAVLPKAHRDEHGNEPDEGLEELRQVMREYRTWLNLRNKVDNSFLAVQRSMAGMSDVTESGFGQLNNSIAEHMAYFKKRGEKIVKRLAKSDDYPIVGKLLAQKGIGPIYVAEIITTLDPAKADTPSAFRKYVGIAGPSSERYTKGEKGGGNKPFRCVIYNLGMNFIKNKNPHYEPLYRRKREYYDNCQRLVAHKGKDAKGRTVNGKEIPWAETNPGRKHLAALRYMNQRFLVDLWLVWRELLDLPLTEAYVIEQLGHESEGGPETRGW